MSDDTKPRCGETSTDLSWQGDDRMRRCERELHADNTHECSRPDGSLYWWTVFPGIVAAVTVGVDHGAPGGDRSVVSTVHQTAAGAMLLSTVVAPKPKPPDGVDALLAVIDCARASGVSIEPAAGEPAERPQRWAVTNTRAVDAEAEAERRGSVIREMHAAAVGEYRDPIKDRVQDVSMLRSRCLAAEARAGKLEKAPSLDEMRAFADRVASELAYFDSHGDGCPAKASDDGGDPSGDDEGCDCFLLLRRDAAALSAPAPQSEASAEPASSPAPVDGAALGVAADGTPWGQCEARCPKDGSSNERCQRRAGHGGSHEFGCAQPEATPPAPAAAEGGSAPSGVHTAKPDCTCADCDRVRGCYHEDVAMRRQPPLGTRCPECGGVSGVDRWRWPGSSTPPAPAAAESSPVTVDRKPLWCPHCGRRHEDRGVWETMPHHTHQCEHCGSNWRIEPYVSGSAANAPAPAAAEGDALAEAIECLDRTPLYLQPGVSRGFLSGSRGTVMELLRTASAQMAALREDAEAGERFAARLDVLERQLRMLTRERDAALSNVSRLQREIIAVLTSLGSDAVRVCEGAGPEDIAASLAVSVAKLRQENERLGVGAAAERAISDELQEIRKERDAALAKVQAVTGALRNFRLNGSDAVKQIEGIYADLDHAAAQERAALARVAELDAAKLEVRPVVVAFAKEMERALKANDHKDGWRRKTPLWLMTRLRSEVSELDREIRARKEKRPTQPGHPTREERVTKEAADVANFAMMIADVAGKWTAAQPKGGAKP